MALYISNNTRQHLVFNFREPVNGKTRHVEIKSGTQVALGDRWSPEQRRAVIDQLVFQTGAVDAAELYGKLTGFEGFSYREDGVISEEEIRMGHEAEMQTREERAVAGATKAALGFDRAVRKREAPGARANPPATETNVEVVQERARGERPRKDDVRFGLSVTPEGRGDVKLPVK